MQDDNLDKIFNSTLTDAEFTKLSKFIYGQYGIKMPIAKKIMLQSRLQKRLRALNMVHFKVYIDYVFSKEGTDEIVHMMDVVSTNKTDFYRESAHFDFLQNKLLPSYINKYSNTRQTIKIWSAGSSSGEEAYTLAMVFRDFLEKYPSIDFSIYATDISTKMLKVGISAIYPEERTEIIPLNIKRKYLLRSKDKSKKMVRIVPELRNRVKFARLNFMDNSYNVNEKFDIVFCRNVLIYFDRETQEQVINKLSRHLKSGGYFFLGHSESITNIEVPLQQVMPTVFTRI